MPFHAVGNLWEILLRVLQEVWRGAVRLKGSVVLVLFVDEEPARLSFVPVYLVHGTAGFVT
jgi:hypothetical protein